MSLYFKNGLSVKDKKNLVNEKVGQKIKTIRKSKKYSQKNFAALLELKGGHTHISRAERGKRSLPAEVLPIIAEEGNTSVEALFRDDVVIVKNIFYDCLTKMNIEKEKIEPILYCLSEMSDKAIGNVGAAKFFDMMFAVIRTTTWESSNKNRVIEEIAIVSSDDYRDNRSRYMNYLREMV